MSLEACLKIYKCPSCTSLHSIQEWDDSTLSMFNSRSDKRAFRSLGIESTRHRGSNRQYVCPSCGKLIMGAQIKTIANKLLA